MLWLNGCVAYLPRSRSCCSLVAPAARRLTATSTNRARSTLRSRMIFPSSRTHTRAGVSSWSAHRVNSISWVSVANMIFLESPAGVGFSYYTGSTPQYNDTGPVHFHCLALDTLFLMTVGVAEDSYTFLQRWFAMYPQYKSNDFWIAYAIILSIDSRLLRPRERVVSSSCYALLTKICCLFSFSSAARATQACTCRHWPRMFCRAFSTKRS